MHPHTQFRIVKSGPVWVSHFSEIFDVFSQQLPDKEQAFLESLFWIAGMLNYL